MQDAPKIAEFDYAERGIDLCLNAFILYEDVATGKRAKETCDILDGRLGSGWKTEIGMSSFKSLSLPELRRHAGEMVHSANLVIFSCYDGPLPLGVRDWTESCLVASDRPRSLVALIAATGCDGECSYAAERFLFEVARRHGLRCAWVLPVR